MCIRDRGGTAAGTSVTGGDRVGQLLSGKELAAAVKQRAAGKAAALTAGGCQPRLAVLLVGEDPASATYVRGKARDCAECGIASDAVSFTHLDVYKRQALRKPS